MQSQEKTNLHLMQPSGHSRYACFSISSLSHDLCRMNYLSGQQSPALPTQQQLHGMKVPWWPSPVHREAME